MPPSLAPERRITQLSTRYLRVPATDWSRVAVGTKTEIRHVAAYGSRMHGSVEPPIPVIAYAVMHSGRREKLMVLEAMWREPLDALSDESLRREGHESLAEFRLAWKRRFQRGRWNPLTDVVVFRVRPWTEEDVADFGERFLRRLYLDVVRER